MFLNDKFMNTVLKPVRRSLADDAILDELLELLLQSSEMIMKRANSNPLVSPRPPTWS